MRFDQDNIVLCNCRKNSNCPTIYPKNEGYEITDDFGGKVKLTDEEFFMMDKAVKEFKKRKKNLS